MDIGFFFSFEGLIVQLPINPPSVKVSYAGNNKTMDIVKLGEINILRNKRLGEISFSSFLPKENWFPGIRTLGQFKDEAFYKDFFLDIMSKSKPCGFVITGLNIDMLVSIEDFDFEHRAGDHEDAYFSIKLKEYKDYVVANDKLKVVSTKGDKKVVKVEPDKARPQTAVTIGSKVKVNGKVHRDSFGAKPGKTLSGYVGRVGLINTKGTHPYHITTPDSGALGWVKKDQVEII